MKYRSSVIIFTNALLAEAARYEGLSIRDFNLGIQGEETFNSHLAEFLSNERLESIRSAQKMIPASDWDEIIDYLCRYQDAYGYTLANERGRPPMALLPWLASIATSALDDIGR